MLPYIKAKIQAAPLTPSPLEKCLEKCKLEITEYTQTTLRTKLPSTSPQRHLMTASKLIQLVANKPITS